MSKSQRPPPGLSIAKPDWKRATIAKDFGGKFSRWKVGEVVYASAYEDEWDGHTIEREMWHGALVPLANACFGVPADVLDFGPGGIVSHAHCCNSDPAICDCVNPNHGTARQNKFATRCAITP